MKKNIYFVILFLLTPLWLWCQQKPVGKFLKNKVMVGEPIQYTLSYKYPSHQDILFPDSTYSFTPFEFVEKKYFKTRSDTLNSFDSAVFTLATYEIDSIQHLALPIFLIENEDTTKIFASPDSIILVSRVKAIPDSIKFFENTRYVKVNRQINYSYWLASIAFVLLVVILFILIFGKTIFRKIKISRLRKQHYKFLVSFKEQSNRVNQENYSDVLLQLYGFWKKYLQQLTDQPYTSFSTKEVTRMLPDEALKQSLIQIDKGIYAHRFPSNLNEVLKQLIDVAQQVYNEKSREVKNGPKKR